MSEAVEIRLARPDEAGRLAELLVRSFRTAFAGLLPAEVLEGDPVEERAERWRRALERGQQTLVAVEGGRIVGLSALRSDEIGLMYVAPEAWRRGIGRALMAASEEHLRAGGAREAVLWVLEANERARRFYESQGWRADDARRAEEESGLPEMRYCKRL